jgi:hypothetical protein
VLGHKVRFFKWKLTMIGDCKLWTEFRTMETCEVKDV